MFCISENSYKRFILFISLILLGLAPGFAATYYVSNSGNDSNSGLTKVHAWKTIGKVNGKVFNPGDSILFRSGDIFKDSGITVHSSGVGNDNIVISKYGSGGMPDINGSADIPNWTNASFWELYKVGIYRMANMNIGTRLFINGSEKKESKTLDLDNGHPWRVQDGYLYLKSPSNPALYFHSLIYSSFRAQLTLTNINNVKIVGIKMSWAKLAIEITNSKNITIENCEIGYKIRGNGIFISSGNNDSTKNIVIRNNLINSGDSLYYTYYRGYHSTGDAVWIGKGSIGVKVYNNYFEGWSHGAVNLMGTSDYPFHNIEVYNNFITAPLIDYARGIGVYFFPNAYNILIHDNTIVNTTVQNQLNGNGLKFYNNIIDNVAGCPYPEKAGAGNGIAIEGTSSPATNMEIYNNTITNCNYSGIRIYGESGDVIAKSGNNIHDNNIFNNGTAYNYQLIVFTSPTIINNTFSRNHLYKKKSQNVVNYMGSSLAAVGFNLKGSTNNDVILGNDSVLTYNIPKVGNSKTDVNNLRIEYNGTSLAKTIKIDQNMIDSKGNRYKGIVSILPFSSVILMKDQTKYFTEFKSICEGSTYNGWTKTGKYERTLISKTGADSVVITNLTVHPKYAITENITINEGESYKGWVKSGQYTRNLNSVSGCDSVVTTNLQVALNTTKQADLEFTQSIALIKGYNLISTYVTVQNPDASVVTKPLSDQGSLIKLQDEAGNSLENWGAYGGWINKLGALENTKGYKILVTNDCTLNVKGKLVTLPLEISLKTGWNIISFPRTDLVNAMNIIQPLIDQNLLQKVQDEAGNSIDNWGLFGGWKNGIGNFVPGKAYKVQMKADAKLTIQENYPKAAVILAQPEKTEYFTTRIEGNGNDQMNINITGLENAGFAIGDELAAFDGDLCVGKLKITEKLLIDRSASLIASFSTDDQIRNGFTEGHPVQIVHWNKLTNTETPMGVSALNGTLNYVRNGSILVKVNSITSSVDRPDHMFQIEVFPNPTQGRFTVRFSRMPDANGTIDILDVSGRKIATRLVTQSSEVFNLEEQAPPGLYLVKTTMNSKEKIHKLIIN